MEEREKRVLDESTAISILFHVNEEAFPKLRFSDFSSFDFVFSLAIVYVDIVQLTN